ncbi:hypothetical protein PIB30_076519 [Stylosanthes scabra]|uniref:Uncharacterized protein n=1 Tax=Stylosanthes scabra TaxID=79078 RepID=A0ABU6UPP0_9FABA|nr:hypothetical protein [Stylosanthes scabra]
MTLPQSIKAQYDSPSASPIQQPCSINLLISVGTILYSHFYYLIRSGALADGSQGIRKNFGHQVFGAVAGD